MSNLSSSLNTNNHPNPLYPLWTARRALGSFFAISSSVVTILKLELLSLSMRMIGRQGAAVVILGSKGGIIKESIYLTILRVVLRVKVAVVCTVNDGYNGYSGSWCLGRDND